MKRSSNFGNWHSFLKVVVVAVLVLVLSGLGGVKLFAMGKVDTIENQMEVEKESEFGLPYRATEKQMQWFRDAKFGMFIHWGPVSVSGGELSWSRGAKRPFDIRGGVSPSEAGWEKLLVPVERYDNLYKEFNPVKFNADQWVEIAKDAGMKYMVLTAKHHDGFSNFDTKVSEYDIMNGPFKRDIVGELAAACQKGGVKYGHYYSQRDWYNPDYLIGDNSKYNAFMHEQIRELLSNYGKIDIMWFDSFGISDIEKDWNVDELITMIRGLQPGILINNRLSAIGSGKNRPKKYLGDYDTPEGRVGKFQTDRAWESCITLVGHQWSWMPGGEMSSFKECIDKLVMCVCGDGNLLLNVGPMPTGEIEARQVARFKEMGDWLGKYGESIYGTRGGPVVPGDWGGTTYKGKTVYVHVLKWDEDVLSLPAMGKIKDCRVLTGGKAEIVQDENGVRISVNEKDRDPIDTIIRLKLKSGVK
ncbi:MAG: alpha-L-fucosidase [Planctomycetes bacterium]|nr:alpha-L-fucosidase [Planctomycetota bacterium]MBL7106180.1 alpha-L-fucosidase [Phycisphaerae bacterium]